MTAVMVASKAASEKGHPCLALKRPLTKLGAPLTNEREEWGGQESREPSSLGPRTLLFVPPPFGLLLRSDHRHLKNNLMHGCSPLLSLLFLRSFFSLWDCTIHDCVGRNEEWRMERRLKVARGVREERGWAWDWNVKLKQKWSQSNSTSWWHRTTVHVTG